MYVDRNFEGEETKPWEGGQYGFVRGPRRVSGDVVFGTLHEGIDIRPVRRDASGEPLDPVLAAADGTVVHASTEAGASNYGRYVVVEHVWEGSPYYTLYAHLSDVSVRPGDKVRQGAPLGRMGYTGEGINKERAHLHFEVCLMLSDRFEEWYARHIKGTPNKHGRFNGMNLVGVEPSRLLLEAGRDPGMKISDYVRAGEPFFKVAVPQTGENFVLRAYPWLRGGHASAAGWEITFSRYGVPLAARPLKDAPGEPVVTWARETDYAYDHLTRGLLTGPPGKARLTDSGKRFMELIVGQPSAGGAAGG